MEKHRSIAFRTLSIIALLVVLVVTSFVTPVRASSWEVVDSFPTGNGFLGIEIDSTGTLYVLENEGQVYRKTAGGFVPLPIPDLYGDPLALAIDYKDDIYISTMGGYGSSAVNNSVLKWNKVTMVWDEVFNLNESPKGHFYPGGGLAVGDTDEIYVTGYFNDSLSNSGLIVFDPTTQTTSILGDFYQPIHLNGEVSLDSQGNVYAVNSAYDGSGSVMRNNGSTWQAIPGVQLAYAKALTIDSNDNVYVGDNPVAYFGEGEGKIYKYDGSSWSELPSVGGPSAPIGMAVDSLNRLHVVDNDTFNPSPLIYRYGGSSHVVTFNSDGGTAVPSQTIPNSSTAVKPTPDPTKENHIFAGWFTDPQYNSEFDFATPITGAITLYAKWELQNQPPVLSLNNGSQDLLVGTAGTITISGTATDPEGDSVTVSAVIDGEEKQAAAAPGNGSWTLSWSVTGDDITEGTYSNIVVSATDGDRTSTSTYTSTITVDRTAPTVTAAVVESASPDSVVITVNEPVQGVSAAGWTVNVNGTPVTLESASSSENTITLTLSTSLIYSDNLTLSYTAAVGSVTDAAGNPLEDVTNRTVLNNVQNRAPQVSITDAAADVLVGNAGTITLSGIATDPEGDEVTVSSIIAGEQKQTTAAASDGSWTLSWSVSTDDIAEDSYSNFVVSATDGSESNTATYSGTITVDRTVPTVTTAVVENASPDSVVITLNEPVQGVSAAGWTFEVNGTAVTVESASSSGITITLMLAAGLVHSDAVTLSYEAAEGTVTDAAGNPLANVTEQSVDNNVQNRAPQVSITDAAADVLVGNAGTITISGTATDPDGDTVSVSAVIDGEQKQVAATANDGSWTLSWSVSTDDITEDTYLNIVVSATDGSESDTATYSGTITVDRTAPTVTAAMVENAAPESVVITLNEPGQGVSAAGWTVEVNGTAVTVESASSSGNTITLTLAAGLVHSDTVTLSYSAAAGAVTDAAGNPLADVTNRPVVNNVQNRAPQVSITDAAADVLVGNAGTITLSGTATDPDGDAVTVSAIIDGELKQTTAASSDGSWRLSWSISADDIAEDTYLNIVVSATDGSESDTATYSGTITVDRTAPTVTTVVVENASPDSIIITFNELVQGVSAAGWTVDVHGTAVTVESASSSGNTITLTLAAGLVHSDTVTLSYEAADGTVTDAAGNPLANVTEQSVDNNVQNRVPQVSIMDATIDVLVGNAGTITLSGTATDPDGDTVSVSAVIDGEQKQTTAASSDGSWTLSWSVSADDIAEDSYTNIVVSATDGSESDTATYSGTITVDRTVPTVTAAVVESASPESVVITLSEPVQGVSAAGWTFEVNGTAVAVESASSSGNVITLTLAAGLVHSDTVTLSYEAAGGMVTDAAGNPLADVTNSPVVNNVQNRAPQVSITDAAADVLVGNAGTITISGTATDPDGDTVTVSAIIDGELKQTTAASSDGSWTLSWSVSADDITEDSYSNIVVSATDGSESDTATYTGTITVDRTAPDAPSIQPPSGVQGATPTIRGTTQSGSTVEVFVNGTPIGQVTADASGSWSYTPTSPWSDGTYSITAKATDEAGNTSNLSSAVNFTVVATIPTLILNGEAAIRIVVGEDYVDAGASAKDAMQRDITNRIVVENPVNSNAIGLYTITYNVSDEVGNAAAEIQRTVTVSPKIVTVTGAGRNVRVRDAVPGAELKLFNSEHVQVGVSGTAESDGTYIFTSVPQGQGYYVTQTVNSIESDPSQAVHVRAPSGGNAAPWQPIEGTSRQAQVTVNGQSPIEQVSIIRKVNSAGKEEDSVVLDSAKARLIVQKAIQQGKSKVSLLIDDLPDNPADEITISVPRLALREFLDHEIALEMIMNHVTIELSQEVLQEMIQEGIDLYFRVVPIRDNEERQQTANRAITAEEVLQVAGNGKVGVLGTPMVIETNYKDFRTKVTFPLQGIEIPADPALAQQLLKSLAVYIEHSDGEKKVARGEIVYNNQNLPIGIQILVDKFSTFTIFSFDTDDGEKHMPYINGYGNNTFAPDRAVSRAELTAMLTRLLADTVEETSAGSNRFTDVPDSHWAAGYLSTMQNIELVNGYPDGTFRPDQAITRAEFAQVAVRLLNGNSRNQAIGAQDIAGHWAYDSIVHVLEADIMRGYENGDFRPEGKLTRAEAVTVLNRLFDRAPLYGVSNPFSDVPASHWALADILEASTEHLLTNH